MSPENLASLAHLGPPPSMCRLPGPGSLAARRRITRVARWRGARVLQRLPRCHWAEAKRSRRPDLQALPRGNEVKGGEAPWRAEAHANANALKRPPLLTAQEGRALGRGRTAEGGPAGPGHSLHRSLGMEGGWRGVQVRCQPGGRAVAALRGAGGGDRSGGRSGDALREAQVSAGRRGPSRQRVDGESWKSGTPRSTTDQISC